MCTNTTQHAREYLSSCMLKVGYLDTIRTGTPPPRQKLSVCLGKPYSTISDIQNKRVNIAKSNIYVLVLVLCYKVSSWTGLILITNLEAHIWARWSGCCGESVRAWECNAYGACLCVRVVARSGLVYFSTVLCCVRFWLLLRFWDPKRCCCTALSAAHG